MKHRGCVKKGAGGAPGALLMLLPRARRLFTPFFTLAFACRSLQGQASLLWVWPWALVSTVSPRPLPALSFPFLFFPSNPRWAPGV